MLSPLLVDQPVLVDGQLLPMTPVRCCSETLVSNWLVRTAELIGSELLDACGEWPELRRYLSATATSQPGSWNDRQSAQHSDALDRLDRQADSAHESRRTCSASSGGSSHQLTEPRDQELNQLGWWQRRWRLWWRPVMPWPHRCNIGATTGGFDGGGPHPGDRPSDRSHRSRHRSGHGTQPRQGMKSAL